MKEITLTKGYVALVDDDDFDHLNEHKWIALVRPRVDGSFRVWALRRKKAKEEGVSSVVLMHRVIAKTPEDLLTDHINGNGLDNRKGNLRICTKGENSRNRGSVSHHGGKETSSKYKGVCWLKEYKKWVAYINLEGKRTYLGYFDDEKEAARAYDKSAKEMHGKFAHLNFKYLKRKFLPLHKQADLR